MATPVELEAKKRIVFAKKGGRDFLYGGNRVIDTKLSETAVPELRPASRDIDPSSQFGESGEVFNHLPWRGLFAMLFSMEISKRSLISLCTLVFMRGKELRIANKGKVITYKIKLPAQGSEERNKCGIDNIIGPDIIFELKINYPSDQNSVHAEALTLERLKCMLRTFMTPTVLAALRFPAVSESIGYGNLVRSLWRYEEASRGGVVEPGTSADYDLWNPIIARAETATKARMNATSATAGCFSSKEIYKEDETIYPGCIWWSGLHALMTDVTNKVRAPSAPADTKFKLENSSFYPDFKKKMSARSIDTVNTTAYMSFLKTMTHISSTFIRSGTQMTADESTVMDTMIGLVIESKNKAGLPVTIRTEDIPVTERAITGHTPAQLDQALHAMIDKAFTVKKDPAIGGADLEEI